MKRVDIMIYCPDVRKFRDSTARERVKVMLEAIDIARKWEADIFLGPEFFFTHHSEQLDMEHPKACIAYSEEESDYVQLEIAKKSEAYPSMLIVAGTCFEALGKSLEKRLFNTAVAFQAGYLVACRKHDQSTDQKFTAACKTKQGEVKETGVGFEFNGINCYLQICADTWNEPVDGPYDLNIVPAYRPGGAAVKNQTSYRYRILSNGEGRYYIYDNVTKELSQGTDEFCRESLFFPEPD